MIKSISLLLSLSLLTGCAVTQTPRNHPGFAAAQPQPVQAPVEVTGSLFRPDVRPSLFEDTTARRVGDILSVILVESTSAQKSADTSASKESHMAVTPPTVFGRPVTHKGINILETDIGSTSDFEGEGESSQSNSLNGSIAVTVTQVLPNGSLRVQGEKRLTINQGSEYIRLSGIVRSIDITPENTVPSNLVADATIMYTGDGVVADSNAAGWFTRFFLSAVWPF